MTAFSPNVPFTPLMGSFTGQSPTTYSVIQQFAQQLALRSQQEAAAKSH